MDLRYLEEVVHSSLKIEREEGELSPMPETEDRQNTLFAHASNVVSGTDTVPRGCYPSKCICILKRLKHYLQELLQAQLMKRKNAPNCKKCELTEDLVDACIPGGVVTVCGIVSIINTDIDTGGVRTQNYNPVFDKIWECQSNF